MITTVSLTTVSYALINEFKAKDVRFLRSSITYRGAPSHVAPSTYVNSISSRLNIVFSASYITQYRHTMSSVDRRTARFKDLITTTAPGSRPPVAPSRAPIVPIQALKQLKQKIAVLADNNVMCVFIVASGSG